MNYCSKRQYQNFMQKVVGWEQKYIDDGVEILKFYLSIEKDTQAKRIHDRANSPLVYWKISKNDFKMLDKWDVFTLYKEQMFNRTSTKSAPWIVINANNKRIAGLNALRYILNYFQYPNKNLPKPKDWSVAMNNYEIFIKNTKFDRLSYEQYKVLLKLKGNKTVIYLNQSKEIYICENGGPELSTGGTGDVLSGVIAALLGQNLSIHEASLLGVAVHAKAGEIFANKYGEIGLNATALIPIIRKLLNK